MKVFCICINVSEGDVGLNYRFTTALAAEVLPSGTNKAILVEGTMRNIHVKLF